MKKKNNKYCDFCGIEIESGTFCFGCFDLFLRHKLTKEDEYTKAVLLADVHKETCSICTGRDECQKTARDVTTCPLVKEFYLSQHIM